MLALYLPINWLAIKESRQSDKDIESELCASYDSPHSYFGLSDFEIIFRSRWNSEVLGGMLIYRAGRPICHKVIFFHVSCEGLPGQ